MRTFSISLLEQKPSLFDAPVEQHSLSIPVPDIPDVAALRSAFEAFLSIAPVHKPEHDK
jgi:hypothetical protein